MADYSLQDFWWNKPSRTESQLPALQLGVQIVQRRAQQDLQERDLANDIARTSLARDEMMFKQNLMLKVDTGNAELAKAAAGITDWSDAVQMKPIYDLGARFGHLVGTKGWEGIINTHERAVTAKQRALNIESLIAQRTAKTDLDFLKEERLKLLADSDIELDDARIKDIDQDIAFAERQQKVREGNLDLRKQELDQKGKRLSIRSQRMYDNELKALNNEEASAVKNATGDEAKRLRTNFNLRRRELTTKFYGTTDAAPSAATPSLAAPESNPKAAEIRESFKQGKITKEQAAQQLRELGFK